MTDFYFTFDNDPTDIMGQPLGNKFVRVTAQTQAVAMHIFKDDFVRVYLPKGFVWQGSFMHQNFWTKKHADQYGQGSQRLHLTQRTKTLK